MKSIALIFGLFVATFCNAQTDKGQLTQGEVKSAELKNEEIHSYSVVSEGNQFMQLHLEQKGVDVRIKALSPTGKRLAMFDSPNGANGPELMTLIAKEKGTYTFEVKPFLKDAALGDYTFELERLEPLGNTPEEKIDQMMALYNKETPGVSISVLKDEELVFSKGYGAANLEYDIPVDNTTIFHIASVSKQFTAFSILLLEEDGELSIDDDIRKYIPELPDFGKKITLRHLANHTSGLRDQWNLLVMAGWNMDDVITTEQVLKLFSRQEELNFNPGEEFLYCNTGFTLLAEVVARVSGMTFAEFTQKRIFIPLGMDNSLFYDDHEKIVKNRAYSYYRVGSGYKKSVLSYAVPGATSLFTTPEDLMIWSKNFDKPKIGNEQTMQTMHTECVLNNGDSTGYGFGQGMDIFKGLRTYSHGGADAGFRTFFARFPSEKLTIAVFGNDAAFNPGGISDQLAEIYIGDLFEEEAENEIEEEIVEQPTGHVKVKKALLNKYTGDFEVRPGLVISISLNGNKLNGAVPGEGDFELIPNSDTLFTIDEGEVQISFPKTADDHVSHLTIHQGGRLIKAIRTESFDASGVDLADYTGKFYSDELLTFYTIELVEDKLLVSHSKLSDFEITLVKKDEFTSANWAFGSIKYLRNEEGELTGIKVSNGRVRNVLFEKR